MKLFDGLKERTRALVVGGAMLGTSLLPVLASAQDATVAFDPAPILAIVTSAQAFIVAIGMAVLTMLLVAKGIKWARRAG